MKKLLGSILALLAMFAFIPGVWAEWKSITDPVQIFEEGYIQVVGVSEGGQSRFKAVRAATVLAQRDLLEIMEGLRLSGQTTVRDGMLQSDDIRTSISGFLRGAIKCGEKYHNDQRYAEVCMKLHIRGKGGLYDVILPLIRENKIQRVAPALPTDVYKPKLIPKVVGAEVVEETVQKKVPEIGGKPATVTETVAVAKEVPAVVFDGLIVDVRDFNFRPALVNTVVTDGEKVVFDPSKILSAILVERGCGGFTTDPGKAKALLQSWGSKKPMIIKGVGVVKMTNAKVSPDDAAAIYLSDQKSNLLAQAKVVFLLK